MAEIKPGTFVRIIGQDTVAEVISVKGNDVEIGIGVMKMFVKKNKLEPVDAPDEQKMPYEEKQHAIDTKEKLLHFQFEMDLRGKMKDEVMQELSVWADDAILLGINEAVILHGRGNGIIKNTVRSILRKYKEVDSLADAPPSKGGEGATIVKFKV